jgi:GTP pyrophosphokinase
MDFFDGLSEQELLDLLLKRVIENNLDKHKIQRAYEIASEIHNGRIRKNGDSQIKHILRTTLIALENLPDTDTVDTSLLHNPLKQGLPLEKLSLFGEGVQRLAEYWHTMNLDKLFQASKTHKKAFQNLRKVLIDAISDPRLIVIIFSNILDLLTQPEILPNHKKKKFVSAAKHVFIPISYKLGLFSIKSSMEDAVFKILEPEEYNKIREKLALSKKERMQEYESLKRKIEMAIDGCPLNFFLYGRLKSIASIYNKIIKKQVSFEDICDLYAFRFIVDKEEDCFKLLQILHSKFPFREDRLRDWITTPKPNGYQSLHTTIEIDGKDIEIQIRTKEMHQLAEYGVAAHWKYKNLKSSKYDDKLAKIRESLTKLKSQEELKEFFFRRLVVISPKGDAYDLPFGATALDFAFAVHTNLGLKAKSAIINGFSKPLETKLNNLDHIAIIEAPGYSIDFSSLKKAKTLKARKAIKTFLNKREVEDSDTKLLFYR